MSVLNRLLKLTKKLQENLNITWALDNKDFDKLAYSLYSVYNLLGPLHTDFKEMLILNVMGRGKITAFLEFAALLTTYEDINIKNTELIDILLENYLLGLISKFDFSNFDVSNTGIVTIQDEKFSVLYVAIIVKVLKEVYLLRLDDYVAKSKTLSLQEFIHKNKEILFYPKIIKDVIVSACAESLNNLSSEDRNKKIEEPGKINNLTEGE